MLKNNLYSVLVLMTFCSFAVAQPDLSKAGKVISDYGKIAQIEGLDPLSDDATFKVSFDVVKQAKQGELNRSLNSVARFINMHADAGVSLDRINLAVVVHGGAVNDMTSHDFYQSQKTTKQSQSLSINANAALISALRKQGVQFYVCGQSATYRGIKTTDLLPGVKMSLSAMTAHALLQQQGYTVNPF